MRIVDSIPPPKGRGNNNMHGATEAEWRAWMRAQLAGARKPA